MTTITRPRPGRLFSIPRYWLALLVLLCCGALQAQETYTVNFKDTDVEELIRFVAQATDKTIIIDPKVKGRVQVISSKPVGKDELYQLFLSILEVHGFAAVESGDVVRVIPSQDARTAPVPVSSRAGKTTSSETITQVIQLENISAAKLIPILRPLAPQQAHMAAYDPSNAIIVSDTAANIARIREVIERIDRTAMEETDVVDLRHASAEEVVRMLEQLQKRELAKGTADSQPLILVADKRTNSVLLNGDEVSRGRAKKLIEKLDQPLQQSGNVQVIYLRYAKAKELSEVLNKVVKNVESMAEGDAKAGARTSGGEATIEADEGTNSLIITADADIMQALTAVIERLDIRRAQVLVEAIIVEMTSDGGRDLGVEWLFVDESGAYGGLNAQNSQIPAAAIAAEGNLDLGGAGDDGDDGGTTPSDPRIALLQAITNTPGSVIGVGALDDNVSFNVLINALQRSSNANILSTPTLLTMDNQEASIVVGQNVPFVTGSYTGTGNTNTPSNPFQTIERENVGITLEVVPHINEGDSLVMEIVQEVSSVTGTATAVNASDIITNERKIMTTVLADDRQTIVLGGLIQDDVQTTQTKVPVLGSIPLVGRLFRSDSSNVVKRHLMVFLKPTIVSDSRTLTGATAEKYEAIRELQLQRREEGLEFFDDDILPLLRDWEERREAREAEQEELLQEIREEQRQREAAQEGAAENSGD